MFKGSFMSGTTGVGSGGVPICTNFIPRTVTVADFDFDPDGEEVGSLLADLAIVEKRKYP